MSGLDLIAAARTRQAAIWTTAHDDTHTRGELAQAATAYAYPHDLPTRDGRRVHKGHRTASMPIGLSHGDPPLGGCLYLNPRMRGRWRLETAGPKWVTLRSLEVTGRHGRFVSHREARADWPNGWERVTAP